MYRKIILGLLLLSGYASAHQFTPTYPVLEQSYIDGVRVAKMELFNARTDVEWFQIDVFDEDWIPVPFAMGDKIFQIKKYKTKKLEIFIREADKDRAVYICSRSRLRKEDFQDSGFASRICSKIK